jgi:16S rRNA (adenine1518-N6/adenine1519-N6)-dimethyltransferase
VSHRPRKRFGQNFLRDEQVIAAVLSAIGPRQDQSLVEIGPGTGALTRSLVKLCKRLDVIEIDRDLVALLKKEFAGYDRLRIHQADALTFDFRALGEDKKLRIIGNLPYNIATPLLFHLFEQTDCIEDMHFMLQKEVVDRLSAGPDGKDYGRLSIMAQCHCRVERLFDVDPESFYPRPRVTSSVVRLTPHPVKPVSDEQFGLFSRIVSEAFSQRRKTLRNSLRKLFAASEIASLGIEPNARAETLDLEDYVALSRYLLEKSA